MITETASWIWIGDTDRAEEFNGDENGKYLFFSSDQELLIGIASDAILAHDFILAKVAQEPREDDYVLCLYWYDDSRKNEVKDLYGKRAKYRWWKNNAATRADMQARVNEADWGGLDIEP